MFADRLYARKANTVYSRENMLSQFVGWPAPGRLDWTDFELQQERRNRIALLHARLKEHEQGPALPYVMLEFKTPVESYDFQRSAYPLKFPPIEFEDVWLTELVLPVPAELNFNDKVPDATPAYYSNTERVASLARDTRYRVVTIAPYAEGKPSFPRRLLLSPESAKELEQKAKVAKKEPAVIVRLYGEFETDNLSARYIRFRMHRIEMCDPQDPEGVIFKHVVETKSSP